MRKFWRALEIAWNAEENLLQHGLMCGLGVLPSGVDVVIFFYDVPQRSALLVLYFSAHFLLRAPRTAVRGWIDANSHLYLGAFRRASTLKVINVMFPRIRAGLQGNNPAKPAWAPPGAPAESVREQRAAPAIVVEMARAGSAGALQRGSTMLGSCSRCSRCSSRNPAQERYQASYPSTGLPPATLRTSP